MLSANPSKFSPLMASAAACFRHNIIAPSPSSFRIINDNINAIQLYNKYNISSSSSIGLIVNGCFYTRNFGTNCDPNNVFSKPPVLRKNFPKLGIDEAEDLSGGVAKLNGGNCFAEKLIVAVDIDEVLGNFVSVLNRYIADRYLTTLSVSEYHVYEFFKIWNCSRDEADIRVHEFYKTPYFKTGIHPIPGARVALNKLSRFCQLSVVTSRQNVIKDHTIDWIEKHFPGLFQEIHFCNHFALLGASKPKSDICKSLAAKVLIDDNPRYAIECAKVGIKVLLFDYENSYPWTKSESVNQHPLVTKVHNWEEVERHLVNWIAA